MKAKLLIDGKELEVEITDEELKKLETKPVKKTGYERVQCDDWFYVVGNACRVSRNQDARGPYSQSFYDDANYYSDSTVAENNARADKLMRQLRRFAVEHRTKDLISWGPISSYKWCIFYDYGESKMCCHQDMENRMFGAIYFESKSKAKEAIETFHDELIWYFTEYKDSL